ncbi:MAG TPA: ATP-binding cassette domain-containing protein, partial [Limnochordia bacterium]
GALYQRARDILAFVGLLPLADQPAAHLSVGQKKLLELARGLAAEPALFLLDEPAAGVNPTLLARIAEHIQTLRQRGVTFLIIEHNMEFVMRLCDRVIVMANGSVLADGPPAAVRTNRAVIEAYLGR